MSAAKLAALRTHPEFVPVLRAVAAGLTEIYQRHPMLNRVFNDRGRTILGWLALYLHFFGMSTGEVPGLTTSRMKALCSETGVCSPGRVTAMLALMRFARYLAPADNAGDRRLRLLVPTERLLDAHRERWVIQLEALARLMPEAAGVAAQLGRTEVMATFLRHTVEGFRKGFRIEQYVPDIARYLERSAGLLMLCSLLLSTEQAVPERRVRISISEIGRRFFVSRAHVRGLLRDAAKDGFIDCLSDYADQIVVRPRLVEVLGTFFGVGFLFLGHCVLTTLADAASRQQHDEPDFRIVRPPAASALWIRPMHGPDNDARS